MDYDAQFAISLMSLKFLKGCLGYGLFSDIGNWAILFCLLIYLIGPIISVTGLVFGIATQFLTVMMKLFSMLDQMAIYEVYHDILEPFCIYVPCLDYGWVMVL